MISLPIGSSYTGLKKDIQTPVGSALTGLRSANRTLKLRSREKARDIGNHGSIIHTDSRKPSILAIRPVWNLYPNVLVMCSLVLAQRSPSFHTLRHAVCSMLFHIKGSGSMPSSFTSSVLKMRRCSFKWELMDESSFSKALSSALSPGPGVHLTHKKSRMPHLITLECRNMGSYPVRFVGSAWSIPMP